MTVHEAPKSTARPEKKVTAAGVSGAAVTVLVYVAGLLGHDLPATVAAAAVLLVVFVAGWLAPHTRRS
ncbi:hypothetical protein KIK06_23330 [Nocardiopsis sp. EMB25]|uniref:hypothetical protein n=1 Tax=Nocardiopsis sp. EMB25 TaxID=2835867 RepID=UPI002284F5C8|nr:hypothetical protein [Nocardiopsis sp. EMB25]MCY9786819.1 hypothetical protein [Nocardiopsis sp. EMB25]